MARNLWLVEDSGENSFEGSQDYYHLGYESESESQRIGFFNIYTWKNKIKESKSELP